MKALPLLGVFIFCAAVGVLAQASRADDPPPSPLHMFPVDLNHKNAKPGRLDKVNVEVGDIIQIFALADSVKKQAHLRTLKVEIKGDAVAMLGLVTVPTFAHGKGDNVIGSILRSRQNISCFLKATKKGSATVKVTPVEKDGRERATREYLITIFPR